MKKEDMQEEFSDRLFRLLKSKKLSVKAFTEKLSIPEKAPFWWRSRKVYPDALTACRMAEELGVTVEYLITGKTDSVEDKLRSTLSEISDHAVQIQKLSESVL